MISAHWPLRSARWRARGAYVAPLLLGASIVAGHQSVRTRLPEAPTVQSNVVGRYMLRSVDGEPLPAVIPSEDPRHTLQVTAGMLELRPDGSYLCRTVATDIDLGVQDSFADTLIGGYMMLSPSAIQLNHKGLKPDTITTSGFQIAWTHPVRTFEGLFLYSK